ncbi:MAG: hypothetical protein RJA57_1571 [Bacteroidota bacterium]|jgi:23S rRNA (guanosine2251-2'-O)-methyltransferase
MLVAGPEMVLQALRDGLPLDKIFIDSRSALPALAEIKRLAVSQGVPLQYVPAAKLESFHVPDHQGLIGQKARVTYYDLQEILSRIVEQGESPLLLILDGITDIRNIGGIARTALCTGVHALIIPDRGVGALNEDAVLTSAGALDQLPVCRVNSLMKAIDTLHLNGVRVYGTEMKAPVTIADADLRSPCAIVMGSEDKGIYPALLKSCDLVMRIPMAGDFESLNVSVATGMILYEAMKQRNP